MGNFIIFSNIRIQVSPNSYVFKNEENDLKMKKKRAISYMHSTNRDDPLFEEALLANLKIKQTQFNQ